MFTASTTWLLLTAAVGLGVIVTVMLARRAPASGRRWTLWTLTTVMVAAAVCYDYRRPMAVILDPLLIFVLIGLYRQAPATKQGGAR